MLDQVPGQSQGHQLPPAEDPWHHTGCQGGLLRRACAGIVAATLLLSLRVVHQHYIQSLGCQLLEVAQPCRVQVTVDDTVAQIEDRLQDTSCRLEQARRASLGNHPQPYQPWMA